VHRLRPERRGGVRPVRRTPDLIRGKAEALAATQPTCLREAEASLRRRQANRCDMADKKDGFGAVGWRSDLLSQDEQQMT
jgi:hypothetical protein